MAYALPLLGASRHAVMPKLHVVTHLPIQASARTRQLQEAALRDRLSARNPSKSTRLPHVLPTTMRAFEVGMLDGTQSRLQHLPSRVTRLCGLSSVHVVASEKCFFEKFFFSKFFFRVKFFSASSYSTRR